MQCTVTINRRNRKHIDNIEIFSCCQACLFMSETNSSRDSIFIKRFAKCHFVSACSLDGAGGVGHQMQWARPRSWHQTNIIPNFLPLLHPKKVDPLKATATQIAVPSDHSTAASAPLVSSADLPLVSFRCDVEQFSKQIDVSEAPQQWIPQTVTLIALLSVNSSSAR